MVAVKDSGMGINPKLQKKLFKIGENINTPGTNKEKGTGLGLAVTYSLVKKMVGEIDVTTEVGKGTSILVSIPLKTELL